MKTLNFLSALGILILITSCTKVPGLINNDQQKLTQFGDGIIDFSTEYSVAPGPWSTFVALGAPDTYPEYGDKQTAWASKRADDRDELLVIAFDTAQYVNHVSIYETYNPGAVSAISVRNVENGSWVPVYDQGYELDVKKEARIMEVTFPLTTFLVDAIKINIASKQVSGWNEIDAVSISGVYEDD